MEVCERKLARIQAVRNRRRVNFEKRPRRETRSKGNEWRRPKRTKGRAERAKFQAWCYGLPLRHTGLNSFSELHKMFVPRPDDLTADTDLTSSPDCFVTCLDRRVIETPWATLVRNLTQFKEVIFRSSLRSNSWNCARDRILRYSSRGRYIRYKSISSGGLVIRRQRGQLWAY